MTAKSNTKNTTKNAVAKTAYDTFLKTWPKDAGPKPSQQELEAAESLGKNGAKVTLALAMYLRDGGATNPEVMMAVGNPQLNKMRELASSGKVKKVPSAPRGNKTVYKIVLKAAEASKKPTKAKGTKKGAAKGDDAGSTPVPVTTQPEVQDGGEQATA